MQASRSRENDRGAGIDADSLIALAVEIREPARERFENIFDSARIVLPGIGVRIFEIQHHAGSAGIQHFHNQVRIVGGTSHLIALITAPCGQFNPPGVRGRHRGRQIIRQLACVSFRERIPAPRQQRALPQSERGVQRSKKLQKSLWEIAGGIEIKRRGIERHHAIRKGQGSLRWIRLADRGSHGCVHAFPSKF